MNGAVNLLVVSLLLLLLEYSGSSELGRGEIGSFRSGLTGDLVANGPSDFFKLLGCSEEFRESVWQQRPLLLRGAMKCEGGDLFSLKTLYDACPTFAAGHVTESGSDNGGVGGSTWKFRPLNPNQLKGEPLQKSHVEDAVKARPPSTISFNTAGSLFQNVGELCLSAIRGLRYPVNVRRGVDG